MADPVRGHHQDRRLAAGPPDARQGRPGHRHADRAQLAPGRRHHPAPRAASATADAVQFEDGSVQPPAAVVWATGFRPDYSWIDVPGVIADGQVVHDRGRTPAPGLFFIGLPWQHTRGSALLGFVGHDAEWLSTHLTAHTRREVLS